MENIEGVLEELARRVTLTPPSPKGEGEVP
jgi:hypothetical protein